CSPAIPVKRYLSRRRFGVGWLFQGCYYSSTRRRQLAQFFFSESSIWAGALIVSFTWDHAAHSTSGIRDVAEISGYQMNMRMRHSLAGRESNVDSHIVSVRPKFICYLLFDFKKDISNCSALIRR